MSRLRNSNFMSTTDDCIRELRFIKICVSPHNRHKICHELAFMLLHIMWSDERYTSCDIWLCCAVDYIYVMCICSDSEEKVRTCSREEILLPSRLNTNDSSSSASEESSSDEDESHHTTNTTTNTTNTTTSTTTHNTTTSTATNSTNSGIVSNAMVSPSNHIEVGLLYSNIYATLTSVLNEECLFQFIWLNSWLNNKSPELSAIKSNADLQSQVKSVTIWFYDRDRKLGSLLILIKILIKVLIINFK